MMDLAPVRKSSCRSSCILLAAGAVLLQENVQLVSAAVVAYPLTFTDQFRYREYTKNAATTAFQTLETAELAVKNGTAAEQRTAIGGRRSNSTCGITRVHISGQLHPVLTRTPVDFGSTPTAAQITAAETANKDAAEQLYLGVGGVSSSTTAYSSAANSPLAKAVLSALEKTVNSSLLDPVLALDFDTSGADAADNAQLAFAKGWRFDKNNGTHHFKQTAAAVTAGSWIQKYTMQSTVGFTLEYYLSSATMDNQDLANMKLRTDIGNALTGSLGGTGGLLPILPVTSPLFPLSFGSAAATTTAPTTISTPAPVTLPTTGTYAAADAAAIYKSFQANLAAEIQAAANAITFTASGNGNIRMEPTFHLGQLSSLGGQTQSVVMHPACVDVSCNIERTEISGAFIPRIQVNTIDAANEVTLATLAAKPMRDAFFAAMKTRASLFPNTQFLPVDADFGLVRESANRFSFWNLTSFTKAEDAGTRISSFFPRIDYKFEVRTSQTDNAVHNAELRTLLRNELDGAQDSATHPAAAGASPTGAAFQAAFATALAAHANWPTAGWSVASIFQTGSLLPTIGTPKSNAACPHTLKCGLPYEFIEATFATELAPSVTMTSAAEASAVATTLFTPAMPVNASTLTYPLTVAHPHYVPTVVPSLSTATTTTTARAALSLSLFAQALQAGLRADGVYATAGEQLRGGRALDIKRNAPFYSPELSFKDLQYTIIADNSTAFHALDTATKSAFTSSNTSTKIVVTATLQVSYADSYTLLPAEGYQFPTTARVNALLATPAASTLLTSELNKTLATALTASNFSVLTITPSKFERSGGSSAVVASNRTTAQTTALISSGAFNPYTCVDYDAHAQQTAAAARAVRFSGEAANTSYTAFYSKMNIGLNGVTTVPPTDAALNADAKMLLSVRQSIAAGLEGVSELDVEEVVMTMKTVPLGSATLRRALGSFPPHLEGEVDGNGVPLDSRMLSSDKAVLLSTPVPVDVEQPAAAPVDVATSSAEMTGANSDDQQEDGEQDATPFVEQVDDTTGSATDAVDAASPRELTTAGSSLGILAVSFSLFMSSTKAATVSTALTKRLSTDESNAAEAGKFATSVSTTLATKLATGSKTVLGAAGSVTVGDVSVTSSATQETGSFSALSTKVKTKLATDAATALTTCREYQTMTARMEVSYHRAGTLLTAAAERLELAQLSILEYPVAIAKGLNAMMSTASYNTSFTAADIDITTAELILYEPFDANVPAKTRMLSQQDGGDVSSFNYNAFEDDKSAAYLTTNYKNYDNSIWEPSSTEMGGYLLASRNSDSEHRRFLAGTHGTRVAEILELQRTQSVLGTLPVAFVTGGVPFSTVKFQFVQTRVLFTFRVPLQYIGSSGTDLATEITADGGSPDAFVRLPAAQTAFQASAATKRAANNLLLKDVVDSFGSRVGGRDFTTAGDFSAGVAASNVDPDSGSLVFLPSIGTTTTTSTLAPRTTPAALSTTAFYQPLGYVDSAKVAKNAFPGCAAQYAHPSGYRYLFFDAREFGYESGCLQNDCSNTHRFHEASNARCSQICAFLSKCAGWDHGVEAGVATDGSGRVVYTGTCWLHSSRTKTYLTYYSEVMKTGALLVLDQVKYPSATYDATQDIVHPSLATLQAVSAADGKVRTLGVSMKTFTSGERACQAGARTSDVCVLPPSYCKERPTVTGGFSKSTNFAYVYDDCDGDGRQDHVCTYTISSTSSSGVVSNTPALKFISSQNQCANIKSVSNGATNSQKNCRERVLWHVNNTNRNCTANQAMPVHCNVNMATKRLAEYSNIATVQACHNLCQANRLCKGFFRYAGRPSNSDSEENACTLMKEVCNDGYSPYQQFYNISHGQTAASCSFVAETPPGFKIDGGNYTGFQKSKLAFEDAFEKQIKSVIDAAQTTTVSATAVTPLYQKLYLSSAHAAQGSLRDHGRNDTCAYTDFEFFMVGLEMTMILPVTVTATDLLTTVADTNETALYKSASVLNETSQTLAAGVTTVPVSVASLLQSALLTALTSVNATQVHSLDIDYVGSTSTTLSALNWTASYPTVTDPSTITTPSGAVQQQLYNLVQRQVLVKIVLKVRKSSTTYNATVTELRSKLTLPTNTTLTPRAPLAVSLEASSLFPTEAVLQKTGLQGKLGAYTQAVVGKTDLSKASYATLLEYAPFGGSSELEFEQNMNWTCTPESMDVRSRFYTSLTLNGAFYTTKPVDSQLEALALIIQGAVEAGAGLPPGTYPTRVAPPAASTATTTLSPVLSASSDYLKNSSLVTIVAPATHLLSFPATDVQIMVRLDTAASLAAVKSASVTKRLSKGQAADRTLFRSNFETYVAARVGTNAAAGASQLFLRDVTFFTVDLNQTAATSTAIAGTCTRTVPAVTSTVLAAPVIATTVAPVVASATKQLVQGSLVMQLEGLPTGVVASLFTEDRGVLDLVGAGILQALQGTSPSAATIFAGVTIQSVTMTSTVRRMRRELTTSSSLSLLQTSVSTFRVSYQLVVPNSASSTGTGGTQQGSSTTAVVNALTAPTSVLTGQNSFAPLVASTVTGLFASSTATSQAGSFPLNTIKATRTYYPLSGATPQVLVTGNVVFTTTSTPAPTSTPGPTTVPNIVVFLPTTTLAPVSTTLAPGAGSFVFQTVSANMGSLATTTGAPAYVSPGSTLAKASVDYGNLAFFLVVMFCVILVMAVAAYAYHKRERELLSGPQRNQPMERPSGSRAQYEREERRKKMELRAANRQDAIQSLHDDKVLLTLDAALADSDLASSFELSDIESTYRNNEEGNAKNGNINVGEQQEDRAGLLEEDEDKDRSARAGAADKFLAPAVDPKQHAIIAAAIAEKKASLAASIKDSDLLAPEKQALQGEGEAAPLEQGGYAYEEGVDDSARYHNSDVGSHQFGGEDADYQLQDEDDNFYNQHYEYNDEDRPMIPDHEPDEDPHAPFLPDVQSSGQPGTTLLSVRKEEVEERKPHVPRVSVGPSNENSVVVESLGSVTRTVITMDDVVLEER
ncbi:unnamed protein product [Amoebophrya sp. A25]|nr:unnamed protein product [Amoebophrya sp. A25]|eukprot:GSA25T00022483001.1